MALDGTWWTTNWQNVRWEHDFSGASVTHYYPAGDWVRTEIEDLLYLCQLDASGSNSENNWNYGRFYLDDDSDTTIAELHYIEVNNRIVGAYPVSGADDDDSHYYTIYSDPDDTTPFTTLEIWYESPGSDTHSLRHYQPYCYRGRVAAVMGAILMHKGLDTDYVDTTNWSDADDGQAAMGSTDDDEPVVFYRREIGETLAETLKKIVAHSWDFLGVNMQGQLCHISRPSPGAGITISGLDITDGVTSVAWRYAFEHLVNEAAVQWGQWQLRIGATPSNSYPGKSDWTLETAWHPQAQVDTAGDLIQEYSDATSIQKFGYRNLGNKREEMTENGERKIIAGHRLPFFELVDRVDTLMARLATDEAQLRREVTVTQDLRGLDYDIGYKITSVELTGDGETISDMRCIGKVVDFRTMTVTSTLFEEV